MFFYIIKDFFPVQYYHYSAGNNLIVKRNKCTRYKKKCFKIKDIYLLQLNLPPSLECECIKKSKTNSKLSLGYEMLRYI